MRHCPLCSEVAAQNIMTKLIEILVGVLLPYYGRWQWRTQSSGRAAPGFLDFLLCRFRSSSLRKEKDKTERKRQKTGELERKGRRAEGQTVIR